MTVITILLQPNPLGGVKGQIFKFCNNSVSCQYLFYWNFACRQGYNKYEIKQTWFSIVGLCLTHWVDLGGGVNFNFFWTWSCCISNLKELDFSRWKTIVNTRLWANQSISKVWSYYVQPFTRRCIYKKVCYIALLTLTFLRSRTNTKCCPVSSTSYYLCTCKVWSCYVQRLRRICIYKKYLIWPWPAKFEVATANGSGDALPRKYIMWPWPKCQGGHGHTKCCPVPSTSRDLCTSKFDIATSHN